MPSSHCVTTRNHLVEANIADVLSYSYNSVSDIKPLLYFAEIYVVNLPGE